MGHASGKDIFRRLGEKLDGLPTRVPRNEALYSILRELYSEEEALVVVKMPYGLSTFDRLEKTTGYRNSELRKILDSLCSKGLVMDLWLNGEYHYVPSPLIVGIFEFTMMRTGDNLNTKEWAKLFYEYIEGSDSFFAANLGKGEKVSLVRALPYEEAVMPSDYIEILDYEKASSLIEASDRFSIGICSCRHKKLHLGKKKCDSPLNTCSQFGFTADFMIRNNFAREVSKSEMLENLARSREMGLVLNADNVRRNITFLCHCCRCCCHALLGISKFGYANAVVTSSFIARSNEDTCSGCGQCAKACPIGANRMISVENPKKKKKKPLIDNDFCLGCGVCALECETGALKLVKRKERVIHPETVFERVILGCLERGTLQNQLFDDPQSITHKFMRGFVGGFLKLPPVKRALMSDVLRSSFLNSLKKGAALQGKGYLLNM